MPSRAANYLPFATETESGNRELIEAIAARYQAAKRIEKRTILDEFVEVSGFRRKHLFGRCGKLARRRPAWPRSAPGYGHSEAAIAALAVLWDAADRICGKRLKEAIPTLVVAMEGHGHLQLDTEVRQRLLTMSAGIMDRLLKPVREVAKQGRGEEQPVDTVSRKSIVVRTLAIGMILRQGISRWIWLRTAENRWPAVTSTAGADRYGKTLTEALPTSAVVRKTEREIAEFRCFQELSEELVEVSLQICQLRPVEVTLTGQEKNGGGNRTGSGARSSADIGSHLRWLPQERDL